MADWLKFQEFLRFKEMSSPGFVPPTPPPPQPPAIPWRTAQQVRKIDYEESMNFLMSRVPYSYDAPHAQLFLHFRSLHQEFPERFALTGELHGMVADDTYYSFRYYEKTTAGSTVYYTFHAHCSIVGHRLRYKKVTLRMGDQDYLIWLPPSDDESKSQ